MKKFKDFFKEIISAIYPNKCIGCGDIINEENIFCKRCERNLVRVNLNDYCTACGFEKDECSCKYNIFRFNGVVSPLHNIGIAKRAYYSYKFGKKQHYADFFAQEIFDAVKVCFDTQFDVVCYVPNYRKREYNHSYYIAQKVADKMQVTFDESLLLCVKKTKKQHKSTIKQRLLNVDGKYIAKHRIDNNKILLIDDIKTTGATLDECARVLLFAGADSVYCTTALASKNNSNKKIEK